MQSLQSWPRYGYLYAEKALKNIHENATALKAPLLNVEVKSAIKKRGRRRDTYEVISKKPAWDGHRRHNSSTIEIMSATNKDEDDVIYQQRRQCFEIVRMYQKQQNF